MEIASLILGIIGLLAWTIPLFGFPVTFIGLILGLLGQKRKKRGIARAGMILSIICLAATIVNTSLGAYHMITGKPPLFW